MRHQKSARELEEREASKTYNIQALVMSRSRDAFNRCEVALMWLRLTFYG